jgi:microcompartment protein CcmK/EutM
MIIARVVGNVIATQKQASHEKKNPADSAARSRGQYVGDVVVALDAVDMVLATGTCRSGRFSAMTSVGEPNSPIDAAVIPTSSTSWS